ncbi:MAG: hypothetical protein KC501_12485 [Myxococcales bacterium]|nr:hypothetical protein [Myxococcales bacterium]
MASRIDLAPWLLVLLLGSGCPGTTSLDDTTTSDTTGGSGSGGSSTSGSTGADDTAGSTTGSSDDGSSGGPGCELPPVDEAVVDMLYVYGTGIGPGSNQVAVGSETALSLAWIDAGFPAEVDACVEWSVDPIEGVSIDPQGVLSVGEAVPDGTVITVTADLEQGRRLIVAQLEVYVPLDSPILGLWTEVEQLPCDGSPAFVPDPVIGELVFDDTGEFSVTWTPFEVYYDYWGTFTHDPGTGALSLTVTGGNYVPPDVDGEGTATVMDGQLVLQDVWLGGAQAPVTPPACGHVFE